MLESPLEQQVGGDSPNWETLTARDRLRLIGALGYRLFTADGVDAQGMGLLLKLSDPKARIWVERL